MKNALSDNFWAQTLYMYEYMFIANGNITQINIIERKIS